MGHNVSPPDHRDELFCTDDSGDTGTFWVLAEGERFYRREADALAMVAGVATFENSVSITKVRGYVEDGYEPRFRKTDDDPDREREDRSDWWEVTYD